jgi:hypothetical protein
VRFNRAFASEHTLRNVLRDKVHMGEDVCVKGLDIGHGRQTAILDAHDRPLSRPAPGNGLEAGKRCGREGTARQRLGQMSTENVRRGRVAERPTRQIRRENLWRVEPHERQRRETEPQGFREEEGVKRLRKPEGAAQPGSAGPVQVASRCLIR